MEASHGRNKSKDSNFKNDWHTNHLRAGDNVKLEK